MRALYFDTETTGLRATSFLLNGTVYPGKICQLAYIIEEDGNLAARNYYFDVPAIDPAAGAVNGLTVPLLHRLSEGQVFADQADAIWRDFAAADVLVAHNFSFDEHFMQVEFERLGMSFDMREKGFCTMRRMAPVLCLPGRGGRYKMPSLQEFAAAFGVTTPQILATMHRLYGAESGAHDARHDTVKMYLALDNACRQDLALAQAFGKFGL